MLARAEQTGCLHGDCEDVPNEDARMGYTTTGAAVNTSRLENYKKIQLISLKLNFLEINKFTVNIFLCKEFFLDVAESKEPIDVIWPTTGNLFIVCCVLRDKPIALICNVKGFLRDFSALQTQFIF